MHYGRDAQADLLIGDRRKPVTATALPQLFSQPSSAPTALLDRPAAQSIKWRSDQPMRREFVSRPVDNDEAIFDRLIALKLASADFSNHLDQAWRAGLFRKLDNLLDADEWDFSDEMPSVESFKTFLRMIVHNKVACRPSLGATKDGKIIASWRHGDDRLIVECFANDHVRWLATRTIDDEKISAAGTSPVRFLRTALEPYAPGVWFG